jgi:hypothetical protein
MAVDIRFDYTIGDTRPFVFTIRDRATKLPKEITGYKGYLTISKSEDPEHTPEIAIDVEIAEDPGDGTMVFQPSLEMTSSPNVSPGEYYFSIKYVDGSSIRSTPFKGIVTFKLPGTTRDNGP